MFSITRTIRHFKLQAASNRSALLRQRLGGIKRPVRVVDLGGTRGMWDRWGFSASDGLLITLANNHEYDRVGRDEKVEDAGYFMRENVDIRSLDPSYYERFDLVFSNSMLEHLYDRKHQQLVARSIVACGKPYFIQVPNRNSIVDPHFPHPLVPFFGAWPRSLQARALCLSGLRGGKRMPSVESALKRLENYVPLARSDLTDLFPNARIYTERLAGIPMSLVAIGPQ